MKFKKLWVVLMTVVMILGTTTAVFAAPEAETYSDTAGNYFFADSDVTVKNGHYFGIFGTGNNVIMENTVTDDALVLAGRIIELNGTKNGGSIFAAGYGIHIQAAEVKGNILAAGRDVTVDQSVTVNAAYLAGEEVAFHGTAKAVSMAGETVIIDGTIDGDVDITAQKVIIGDGANITGTLKIKAEEEPQLPTSAKAGKIEFTKSVADQPQNQSMQDKILTKVMASIFTLIAMFILGLAICLICPRQLDAAAMIFKGHKIKMLLTGFLFLIFAPLIFVILCITGVGAPLGIVGLLLYVICMIIAVPFMAASIVRKRIPKIPAIIPSLLGIIIFQLLKIVPYLSGVIFVFAVLYTFGSIVLIIFSRGKMGQEDVSDDQNWEKGTEQDVIDSAPESAENTIPEVVEEVPLIEESSETEE